MESRKDELEEFHQVLTDISLGIDSNLVRRFIVESYVRGMNYSAETCAFEGRELMRYDIVDPFIGQTGFGC